MVESSGGTIKQEKTYALFWSILASVLFIYVFWKVSGISFNLSAQSYEKLDAIVFKNLEERASGRADLIDILTWVLFAGVGALLHIVHKDRAIRTWVYAWPLLTLIVLIILSVSWSDVPDIGLRRSVKHLLFMTVVAGIVMGAASPKDILRLAVVCTGVFMALNWASVFLFPAAAYFQGESFQGLHGHKNSAGVFAMISVFVWFSAARCSRDKRTQAILFAGTLLWFLFLLGTNSRTSVVSTVLAIVAIVSLRRLVRRPGLLLVSGLGTLFMACVALFVLVLFNITFNDIVLVMEGDRTTLTGRFVVWEFVTRIFLERPLLGTGYGSLWSAGNVAPAELYSDAALTGFLLDLTHSHNGYLDVLVTLGLIGGAVLALFLCHMSMTIIKAFRSTDPDDVRVNIAEIAGFVLLTSIAGNLTRTTFLRLEIEWAALILCYLMICWMRPADERAGHPIARSAEPTSPSRSIPVTPRVSIE